MVDNHARSRRIYLNYPDSKRQWPFTQKWLIFLLFLFLLLLERINDTYFIYSFYHFGFFFEKMMMNAFFLSELKVDDCKKHSYCATAFAGGTVSDTSFSNICSFKWRLTKKFNHRIVCSLFFWLRCCILSYISLKI